MTLAGLLMGVSNSGVQLVRASLLGPYALLSGAPDYVTLPLLCFWVCMAAGIAAVPAGVAVFNGDELLVYWRGAAAGHSPVGYYLGRTAATLPRIALAGAHFAVALHAALAPMQPLSRLAAMCIGYTWCMYGLGAALGIAYVRSNAALIAVIVSMVRCRGVAGARGGSPPPPLPGGRGHSRACASRAVTGVAAAAAAGAVLDVRLLALARRHARRRVRVHRGGAARGARGRRAVRV